MKFLGTSSRFAGDTVYAVQPQGYLNATENADRVIQTVLEPAMRQGKCLRVADNLITEGNTPDEAAKNYELIGTSGGVAVSRRQAVDLQRR